MSYCTASERLEGQLKMTVRYFFSGELPLLNASFLYGGLGFTNLPTINCIPIIIYLSLTLTLFLVKCKHVFINTSTLTRKL